MPLGSTVRQLLMNRALEANQMRYLLVGLVCAVGNNVIIIGMDQGGAHYLAGTATATVVGTLAAFLLHCRHTFRVAPSWSRLGRFCAATAAGSFLTFLSMAVLCDGFGFSATAAIPITTVALFAWNYSTAAWALIRKSVPIGES